MDNKKQFRKIPDKEQNFLQLVKDIRYMVANNSISHRDMLQPDMGLQVLGIKDVVEKLEKYKSEENWYLMQDLCYPALIQTLALLNQVTEKNDMIVYLMNDLIDDVSRRLPNKKEKEKSDNTGNDKEY